MRKKPGTKHRNINAEQRRLMANTQNTCVRPRKTKNTTFRTTLSKMFNSCKPANSSAFFLYRK